ncbi:MAG: putative glutamine amidotransferase [Prokaryotic dsDNA virus sp.]|nr:MAG: putative glutamine amidotransferase [Prokaryotic dsDNA virus sp.]
MCGIIGYNGKDLADPTILSILFLENDTRGGHSTGYHDNKKFVKVIGTSQGLYQELQEVRTKKLIGHTRYATHGAKTTANQHPFKSGKWIGCHNGVLSNYKEVGNKYKIAETEVDSQMIFELLNKTGNMRMLGKFSGKLATLFQCGDGFMYAYRRENPLFVGRDEKGNAYFSSLKTPLEYCNLSEIYGLEQNFIYKFKDGAVVDKIKVKHKPIATTSFVNTNWRSYGTSNNVVNWKKKKSTSNITDRYSQQSQDTLFGRNDRLTSYDWDMEDEDAWNNSFSLNEIDNDDANSINSIVDKLEDIDRRYGSDLLTEDSAEIRNMIDELKSISNKVSA